MKTRKLLSQIIPIQYRTVSIIGLSLLMTACNPAKWDEPDSCVEPIQFYTATGSGTNQRKANVDAKNNWEDQVRVDAPGYSKFKRSIDRTWVLGGTRNPHTSTVTAKPCGKP